MTRYLKIVPLALVIVVAGCRSHESPSQQHHEANTPAGKVGQAAHEVAKDAGKAARVVGRQLGKAAHQAHEGWKEAGERERAKSKAKD